VEIRGTIRPDEIVVIGAHYDTAPGAPGADDNATGCAATLVLARAFAGKPQERTMRFVLFTNEEPPNTNATMGSLVYARQCKAHGDNIVAMMSLETIGYFSDVRGSQKYPFPINLVYPPVGDFLGIVGNIGSRGLVRQAIGTFRQSVKLPTIGLAAPAFIKGVDWSDHASFWEQGYPGVMVTDTALFRNPHYHKPTDTPDKIDYPRLARVVNGLEAVAAAMARSNGGR
jgi:Zn-dependent M28 family amino/carboxypeptidase